MSNLESRLEQAEARARLLTDERQAYVVYHDEAGEEVERVAIPGPVTVLVHYEPVAPPRGRISELA